MRNFFFFECIRSTYTHKPKKRDVSIEILPIYIYIIQSEFLQVKNLNFNDSFDFDLNSQNQIMCLFSEYIPCVLCHFQG